ncbi:MAG: hypothetical protein R2731_19630 [Nocardioides sp.]
MPDTGPGPAARGGGRTLGDHERVAYFVAGLVAAFVLAFFLGRVVGPALGLGDPPPREDHSQMSGQPRGVADRG